MWRLKKDRSGNFGMMSAIVFPVLLGAAGMAVDVATALMTRSTMDQAADAAMVGVVSEKSAAAAKAFQMTEDGNISVSEAEAVKFFKAELPASYVDALTNTSVSVMKVGSKLKTTFSYQAKVPTTFLRVIGQDSVDIAGSVTTEYQLETFRDFYVLVDNTPSMGVAATPADVSKMVANTGDKCAFACHINNAGVEDKNDYYNLAKKLGVTIRIDVVAQATAALMDTATNQRVVSNQYRMAIYTFGEKAEDTKLLEVTPPTVDLALAKTKAAGIQLMTIPKQGYNNDQQTSFDNALTQIKTKMGAQGSGTSSADSEKVVLLVSDGVGDSYKPTTCTKPTTGGRCQEPLDVKLCDALKAQNYKVAVLYTTYLPLPTNSWYNSWIAPFQNEIPTKMKACASDGLFFEVTPTQGIKEAMSALFMKIVTQPRITS